MGAEIERKFLVLGDGWREGAKSKLFRQGYLCNSRGVSVRVRLAGEKAFLTIKGETHGLSRAEFEYPIPIEDAGSLLDCHCEKPIIEKTRYIVEHGGMEWEVDEFHGGNDGLIMAELELPEETTPYERPPWLGEEVTGDARYYNVNLVANPYSTWNK